jgi:sugar phosphate isomerase/epimerase
MKLGIGSYTFSWAVGVPGHPPDQPVSAQDLLDMAGEIGVGVVQIADNLPLHRLSPAEIASLADRASADGIEVEVGTRGIAHEHLHTYLDLAVGLGSPILRVVVDTATHQPTPDEIVKTTKAFLPALDGAGVTLAIENHDRFPSATLTEILERIDNERVGICLDTVNSFGALEGPEAVVEALGPWTVNLHVKDFAVQRVGHHMGFTIEGRPAGQGQLDVPWLLQKLPAMAGRDNRRPISAAILELWTPPQETLEETIAKEKAWAAESIEYLRQFIPD